MATSRLSSWTRTLGVVCAVLGVARAAGVTPADTVAAEFSQLPQLVFPQQPLSALDPRRHLSLQQQTHILADVQQNHHRFPAEEPAQPQALLYSQQVEFGAEQTTTEKPFLYTQQSQFASQHHKSTPSVQIQQSVPNTVVEVQPSVSSPQHAQFRAPQQGQFEHLHPQQDAFNFGDKTSVPVSRNNEQYYENPQRTTRRRPVPEPEQPHDQDQEQIQVQYRQRSRPRARLEDQHSPEDQLFLQNDRQKLFQQLKDYNQQKQQPSEREERIVSSNSPNPERQQQQQRPVPQAAKPLANDNPLKAQESKPQPKINPLRQQQQQQQLQAQLQKQFQLQLLQRQELIRQLKQAISNAPAPTNADQIVPNPSAARAVNTSAPLFLANGQKLQLFQGTKQPKFSPAPEQSIVIRSTPTSPPTTTTTTTLKPPKVLFEELTKGVLPPGAEFEVIRHKQDGGLEEVGKFPQNLPEKKVTFVFLEEQPDGTLKVQGVRGNGNGQPGSDQSPADVDSIIKKIQEGDLKLPPSSKLSGSSVPTGVPVLETTPQESVLSPTYISRSSLESLSTTQRPNSLYPTVSSKSKDSQIEFERIGQHLGNSPPQFIDFKQSTQMEFIPSVTIPTHFQSTVTQSPFLPINPDSFNKFTPSPTDPSISPYSVELASNNNAETLFVPASSSQTVPPPRNQFPVYTGSSQKPKQEIVSSIHIGSATQPQFSTQKPVTTLLRSQYSPTPSPVTTFASAQYSSPAPKRDKPPRPQFVPTAPSLLGASAAAGPVYKDFPTQVTVAHSNEVRTAPRQNVVFPSHDYRDTANVSKTSKAQAADSKHAWSLTQVLKKEGLFAMAKFLKESGLDNILNDTGPYTVFAPTDKAFRALLIQLGGPDKAEEKFRENPRLLSGLLLHHVIPGAFQLASLQDEMTGVSLAGTQLRVNTYDTQDVEWNDVQVTTINGARILRTQRDLPIPQGVAHAVDRVMFPLPVGDVVQTLQADRERRFTKFLRAIQTSGLAETLTGSRSFTVFAPTDRAFSSVLVADQTRLLTDSEMARALVERHVAPGTLFSAGMRYYQVRSSLDPDRAVTLLKNAGQLKANDAHVVTHNIPATNGVIHAIDSLL